MKESIKTLAIAVLAAFFCFLWITLRPQPPKDWSQKGTGEALFPALNDADKMAKIIITRSDGPDGAAKSIRLQKEKDGWVIAEASNAPADNADRMTMITAPLLGLTVLAEMSEMTENAKEERIEAFHRECKLLDPVKASPSEMKDAGIRVTIAGAENEILADFIVGAIPPESSAVRDIRYLRLPTEDAVLTVDFSAETMAASGEEKMLPYVDRLSVAPVDWMNRDILRISRWKIAELAFWKEGKDAAGKGGPVAFIEAKQDPESSLNRVWELIHRVDFSSDGKGTEAEITDDKRYPSSLNGVSDRIAHLTLAGIERKPENFAELFALGRPVQEMVPLASEFNSLGYFFADFNPLRPEDADPKLCGEGGEIDLTMADGTKRTLLFGKKIGEDKRRLLVVPSLNPDFFPKPEFLTAAEDADAKEVKRIQDENNLRKSEYDLNLAEANRKFKEAAGRFHAWFFWIDESDYQKIWGELGDLNP